MKKIFMNLMLVGFMFWSAKTYGAVFNVTNSSEFQAALEAASSNGQDDVINLAAGNYPVDLAHSVGLGFFYEGFTENFSLTINGAGAANTFLDGINQRPVLTINNNSSNSNKIIIVQNVTIRNGRTKLYGAGIRAVLNSIQFSLLNSNIQSNQTGDLVDSAGDGSTGAGVWIDTDGVVRINNNTFSSNTTLSHPGPSVELAGGLYLYTSSLPGPDFFLYKNNFINNSSGDGGGAYIRNNARVLMQKNTFSGNYSTRSGAGALLITRQAEIYNNLFNDNIAQSDGGAFFLDARVGYSKIFQNTLVQNEASKGGGGFITLFTSSEDHFDFKNNIAYQNIATQGGDILITHESSFSDGLVGTVLFENNDFSHFDCQGKCSEIVQNGNLDVDPAFVDTFNNNFHLRNDSPLVNDGLSSLPSNFELLDLDGGPRIIAMTPDIGMDETSCGNATLEESLHEVCDDGNGLSGDGCAANCILEFCGDGKVNNSGSELCDNGSSNSDTQPNACRTNCQPPKCGDGVIDRGESCDDRNLLNNDGCSSSCVPETCGDGIKNMNEECDLGFANSDQQVDGCRTNCLNHYCGDGVVDSTEECDDHNIDSKDGCDSSCKKEIKNNIPQTLDNSSGAVGKGVGGALTFSGGGCAMTSQTSPDARSFIFLALCLSLTFLITRLPQKRKELNP